MEQGGLAAATPLGTPVAPYPTLVPPAPPPRFARRLTQFGDVLGRFVQRRALVRAALAVPRTVRFVADALATGRIEGSVEAPRVSPGLTAQVGMEELVMSLALSPRRFPAERDYQRVHDEVATARALYRSRGWLEEPLGYHRDPPALSTDDVTVRRCWAGMPYERVDFDSGFTPHQGEPGAERWASYGPNHRASAVVLRHPGAPRPWVIAVHGYCMGWPLADFQGLHAKVLHHRLGLNVALPVLPLHGPRRVTTISGLPFLSFDLMNGVHGVTQSVWDVRRLLTWIRAQGAPSVAVYGISLGGHVVSLLSGIEPGIDAVVAGVPVTDLPSLYEAHSPREVLGKAVEHGILGTASREVYSVVSPLQVRPRMARERRFVFGGYGDRMARPGQAHRLWLHWERPAIHWYPGNHVGYLWSRPVTEFLASSLRASGLSHEPTCTLADA